MRGTVTVRSPDMPYTSYLKWEGACSIALGLALAAAAFPGLFVSYRAPGAALLLVPAVLVLLALIGRRAGASPAAPGQWLTERPLRGAVPGRPALPAARLRRRLVLETVAWVVVGVALVAVGSSGWLLFGTGLASVAFGLVQAVAAPARVAGEERRRGARYAVARRAGIGTPGLTVRAAGG